MPLKINIINCPSCAAAIPVEEGKTQVTCSYCGSKFTITNENEFVYRHVDEAKLKQAEIDRLIRLKELEMEEKQRQVGNIKLLAAGAGLLALILILAIGSLFDVQGLIYFGTIGIMIYVLGAMMVFMEKTSSKDREKELEISRNAAAQNRFDLSTPASKEELVPKHRFCGHCGAKLMEDAKFCHKCGRVAAKLPIPPKGGKQKRKVH